MTHKDEENVTIKYRQKEYIETQFLMKVDLAILICVIIFSTITTLQKVTKVSKVSGLKGKNQLSNIEPKQA